MAYLAGIDTRILHTGTVANSRIVQSTDTPLSRAWLVPNWSQLSSRSTEVPLVVYTAVYTGPWTLWALPVGTTSYECPDAKYCKQYGAG